MLLCFNILAQCFKYQFSSRPTCVKHLTKVVTTEELYDHMNSGVKIGTTNNKMKEESGRGGEDEIAMILYTSGSSGEPKGVRLSHNVIFSRLNWFWTEFPFQEGEKCVFKTSLTFLDSVVEIFGTLLQGFHVTVFDTTALSKPSIFLERMGDYQITRVLLVPTLLKAICERIGIIGNDEGRKLLGSIKFWLVSGEPLSTDLLKDFFEIFHDDVKLVNSYGATEVGDVTFVKYTSERDVDMKVVDNRVPIGFPQFNMAIIVLDENLQPVPKGDFGEIFIAGSNLACGYVGIEDSENFIDNPYTNTLAYPKLYKTRDFGNISVCPDGHPVLMYHGRMDSQIKVGGQSVDLLEMEVIIFGLESVKKAKVLCSHPGQSDQAIVVYIVPKTHELPSKQRIRKEIANNLPKHELLNIRFLEEIPLLVNGKTDRQLLLKVFASENGTDEWKSLVIPEER